MGLWLGMGIEKIRNRLCTQYKTPTVETAGVE